MSELEGATHSFGKLGNKGQLFILLLFGGGILLLIIWLRNRGGGSNASLYEPSAAQGPALTSPLGSGGTLGDTGGVSGGTSDQMTALQASLDSLYAQNQMQQAETQQYLQTLSAQQQQPFIFLTEAAPGAAGEPTSSASNSVPAATYNPPSVSTSPFNLSFSPTIVVPPTAPDTHTGSNTPPKVSSGGSNTKSQPVTSVISAYEPPTVTTSVYSQAPGAGTRPVTTPTTIHKQPAKPVPKATPKAPVRGSDVGIRGGRLAT